MLCRRSKGGEKGEEELFRRGGSMEWGGGWGGGHGGRECKDLGGGGSLGAVER